MSESPQNSNRSQSRLWRYALAVALAWTAFIAATMGWNVFAHWHEMLNDARRDAQISFQKEMLFHFWKDVHGGGDAPATNNAPSSPRPSRAEERDLLYPAAMLRQAQERGQDQTGHRSHLVGLKPLRPENAPDAWETRVLKAFEKGETEVSSVEMIAGQKYMRVMRPLVAEASCLVCHSAEDYKVGNIRGGLSVSVPLAPQWAAAQGQLAALVIGDGIIWLLGLGAIGFGARRVQAHNLERAKATETLQESAQSLEEAQRLARIGSWHWAVATDTVNWSKHLYDINGRDPKLPAPRFAEMSSCYTPESWNRLSAAVAKALHAGESYGLELEMVRPDGTTRHTLAHGEAEYDTGGKIVGLHGAVQDITERKQAEKTLRESEARYRSLFSENADGILIADIETKTFKYANPALCRMLGYTEDELRTMGVPDIHPKDAVPSAVLEFEAGVRGEKTLATDIPCLRKDGSVVYADINSTKITVDDRPCNVGFFRDITERKRAQQALAALSSRQEAILAAVPDIIMEVDNHKVYTWVNQAGLAFFGDDVIGKKAACYFEGEQTTYQSVEPLFNGLRDLIYVESWQRRKDGEKRLLAWWCRVLKHESGNVTGALSSAWDITERKALEEQLRQSQKMAAVGQLAGGVAHEFNNMLAVIRGNAELLLMDEGQHTAEIRESLTRVVEASERAANLTRQLLTFSRKQVMQPQPLALNEVFANLTKMLNQAIRENIDLQCHHAALLPYVQADPGMMEQVILNLVVNARDAMPEGGQLRVATEQVTLDEAHARVNPEARAGDFVCLSVSDTGTGRPGGVAAHFRAVLHHQGNWQGHGAGAGHGLWHRQAAPGLARGVQPARRGQHVQSLSACHPNSRQVGGGSGGPWRE